MVDGNRRAGRRAAPRVCGARGAGCAFRGSTVENAFAADVEWRRRDEYFSASWLSDVVDAREHIEPSQCD